MFGSTIQLTPSRQRGTRTYSSVRDKKTKMGAKCCPGNTKQRAETSLRFLHTPFSFF
jgi:hypothetical protein